VNIDFHAFMDHYGGLILVFMLFFGAMQLAMPKETTVRFRLVTLFLGLLVFWIRPLPSVHPQSPQTGVGLGVVHVLVLALLLLFVLNLDH
jgi:hypothetical protein